MPRGYQYPPITFSTPLEGLNLSTFLAGMSMDAPVAGLRPRRASRWMSLKIPSPDRVALPSFLSPSIRPCTSESSIWLAFALLTPVLFAMGASRSLLVICCPPMPLLYYNSVIKSLMFHNSERGRRRESLKCLIASDRRRAALVPLLQWMGEDGPGA